MNRFHRCKLNSLKTENICVLTMYRSVNFLLTIHSSRHFHSLFTVLEHLDLQEDVHRYIWMLHHFCQRNLNINRFQVLGERKLPWHCSPGILKSLQNFMKWVLSKNTQIEMFPSKTSSSFHFYIIAYHKFDGNPKLQLCFNFKVKFV